MEQARHRTGLPLGRVLAALGLDAGTYHRWRAQAAATPSPAGIPSPTPEASVGRRTRVPAPTPAEREAVRQSALQHPLVGYKRLAARLLDSEQVCLPAYQVLEILREADLLARRQRPRPGELRRPEPPTRPDEVWHTDLMYVRVGGRWCYLVDILDGYSRYLVHWSLNLTMVTETVVDTVQAALERLEERRAGEPRMVHDSGSQFVSGEWKRYLVHVGATGIRTRVAHPESNGRVERLHRTHREEALLGEALRDLDTAREAMERWEAYYNWQRPHSALHYLTPGDYYRGDVEARLRERAERMARAREKRQAYWDSKG